MTTTRILAAALLIAAATRPCSAQRPASLGTASALGDAAVTEARRADALMWNPAAIGIYDGPLSSYRVLSAEVAAAPGRSWSAPARRLGLSGLPHQLEWVADLKAGAGAAVAQGQAEWLATQVRGLAVSIGTGYLSAGDIPEPLRASLGGGDSIGSPAASDSTLRVTASTLAIGRGIYAGVLPVAGRVWLGATAKGWLVHSYARGAFTSAEPGPDVYREALLENIPGYGVDVGVITQPMARLRLGAAVSNVVSGSWRPERGPRVRTVSITEGADGEPEVTATTSPYLGAEDDGTEESRAGLALWRSARFPAVLRAGVSLETNSGTISAATSTELTEGGLDPRWDATPVTLAFAGTGRMPVRASYGWGSDARQLSLGLRLGGCRRQWNVALTRRSGEWGSALGAGFSLTTGSAAGCNLFRT